jgi:hypothetical protein
MVVTIEIIFWIILVFVGKTSCQGTPIDKAEALSLIYSMAKIALS